MIGSPNSVYGIWNLGVFLLTHRSSVYPSEEHSQPVEHAKTCRNRTSNMHIKLAGLFHEGSVLQEQIQMEITDE